MSTDNMPFDSTNRRLWQGRTTRGTGVCMAVWTGAVFALVGAAVAGASSGSAWTPPANQDDILRYKVQDELASRLRTKIEDSRRLFEKKVTDLGETLYKSGVTPADLQHLAEKVFTQKGTKNPTTNYQEDLKAVVEAAVGDVLSAKDVGAMKEYVRKDLIRKMMLEVAIKGMEEVNHLMTLGEMDPEEVIRKAHDEAKRRFNQEIEAARTSGRLIKDANALWKTIQQEEFAKAARNWMLETLRKNWGIPRDTKLETVEKGVEARVDQLKEFDRDLASFVEEMARDLLTQMKQSKSSDKEIRAKLQELFTKIKAGGVVVSKEKEAELMAGVPGGTEKPTPVGGGTPNPPTIPPPTNPGTQLSRGGGQGGNVNPTPYSPNRGTGGSARGGAGGNTSAGTGSPSELYECQFLIELKMKSENTSEAVITVHLCQPGADPGAGIQREGVMPPKEIPVRAFTIRDIQAAAKAIQEALESQNGMNLCVDQAQQLGMKARAIFQAPPVKLNCYLKMRDPVFGPVWIDAVKMGVENTAKNVGWKSVSIQFMKTL